MQALAHRQGNKSFGRKLLFAVFFVVLSVEAIALVLSSLNEAHRMDRALEVEANSIANLAADLLALPLWDLNYPVISSMIDGLNEDGQISTVRLIDESGNLIANQSWPAAPAEVPPPVALTLERPISFNSLGNEEIIGRLEIDFNSANKPGAIKRFIAFETFTTALTLCALVAIFAHTTKRLSKPLVDLSQTVRKIKGGNLDEDIPSTNRLDEIGHLARALEQLRDSEKEVAVLRRESDIENQKERRRMVEALSAANDAVLLFDERGIPVFRNRSARELLWGIDDAGRASTDFVQDDEQSRLRRALHDNSADDFMILAHDKSESDPRHLHLRIDPIMSAEQENLGRVLIATDVSEQIRQQESVDHLARHDELTGLPNRRALKERLDDLFARHDGAVGMLLFDMDRFKTINDTHGHQTGDQLLCTVAQSIRDVIDMKDLPVRMGGDEFAIIGIGPDTEDRLSRYADHLIKKFSKPVKIGKITALSGMSVGLSVVDPGISDGQALVQYADLALYEAKRLGRGRIEKYDHLMQQNAFRNAEIGNCLAHALDKKSGVEIDLQLQTDIYTRDVVGLEALARLRPVNTPEIYPDEFIPIAEETGLIGPLTIRVLELSMQNALDLADKGFNGRIAVNISPKLFALDLFSMIESAETKTGCPPELIELEITESALVFDEMVVETTISRLRHRGYTIALDDFGTGYSAFGHLKNFSFDKLKIDRIITQQATEDQNNLKIISAISEIGAALGMRVVAEGIEDEQSLEALKQTGTEILQGWIDGKPMRPAEFAEFLDKRLWLSGKYGLRKTAS